MSASIQVAQLIDRCLRGMERGKLLNRSRYQTGSGSNERAAKAMEAFHETA